MKRTYRIFYAREAWLHIDHIDNKDKAVWAITIPGANKCIVVHEVEGINLSFTALRVRRTQPRAYILFGQVKISVFKDSKGKIKAVIE